MLTNDCLRDRAIGFCNDWLGRIPEVWQKSPPAPDRTTEWTSPFSCGLAVQYGTGAQTRFGRLLKLAVVRSKRSQARIRRVRDLFEAAVGGRSLLDGLRVLVIEDEPTLAFLVGKIIEDAEGELVGSCASVREARELLRSGVEFDCALLDVNLADGDVAPVLEALRARGLPVVVQTGGQGLPDRIRKRHPDLKVLQKPVRAGHLVGELRKARLRAEASQSAPA